MGRVQRGLRVDDEEEDEGKDEEDEEPPLGEDDLEFIEDFDFFILSADAVLEGEEDELELEEEVVEEDEDEDKCLEDSPASYCGALELVADVAALLAVIADTEAEFPSPSSPPAAFATIDDDPPVEAIWLDSFGCLAYFPRWLAFIMSPASSAGVGEFAED